MKAGVPERTGAPSASQQTFNKHGQMGGLTGKFPELTIGWCNAHAHTALSPRCRGSLCELAPPPHCPSILIPKKFEMSQICMFQVERAILRSACLEISEKCKINQFSPPSNRTNFSLLSEAFISRWLHIKL